MAVLRALDDVHGKKVLIGIFRRRNPIWPSTDHPDIPYTSLNVDRATFLPVVT